jgi:hypothetical protein
MMENGDNDGTYCTICGGIRPDKIKVRQILIDGKETGIDQLDLIMGDVKKQNLSRDDDIVRELMKRVRAFNYVPTKKSAHYEDALLREYRKSPG